MTNLGPHRHDNVELLIDDIIWRLGKDLRLGIPLGLGKPFGLVNALYRRACADPSLKLTILTALSLEKPKAGSTLEQAVLGPFVERVFAGVPDLDYMAAVNSGSLPPNVEVCEFFFRPGSMLRNPGAQQHYLSTNYTFAARDVFERGCNLVAQSLRLHPDDPQRCSLSCNPDTGIELLELLKASGRNFVAVGETNDWLPYMGLDAEVPTATFDLLLDHPDHHTALFPTPKMPVATADYMVGLAASALVKDGGTLQVGIGALGDAIVQCLGLRHEHNDAYRDWLTASGLTEPHGELIERFGGASEFALGLYGATEMFVDGFRRLIDNGVMRRAVYDFWALQQLINEGRCNPQQLEASVLDHMVDLGVRVIRTQDFALLQWHGFFSDDTDYDQGYIVAADGTRVIANVADPEARSVMAQCLGTALRNGVVVHGGFFLGPASFYAWLNDMSQAERDRICMTGVYKINQLDHNPRLYQQQRQHARFINTGMMATLSGAVVSDGLEDLRVVSGVGGQYNFVAMAHQLRGGRSILLVRAVREEAQASNIVFNYGHTTIPRHLRDIVVTEYGIADLRAKTDSEVAKALINIADSRFQASLLQQAKDAGKIEATYEIPSQYRNNTPERLERIVQPLRERGLLPAFPLGCDFTDEELTLIRALKAVKAKADTTPTWRLLLDHLLHPTAPQNDQEQQRMRQLQLDQPASLGDKVTRGLILKTLREQAAAKAA